MRRREQKAQQYVKGGCADVAGLLQALSYGCSCVCVCVCVFGVGGGGSITRVKSTPGKTPPAIINPWVWLRTSTHVKLRRRSCTEDGEGFVGPKSAWLYKTALFIDVQQSRCILIHLCIRIIESNHFSSFDDPINEKLLKPFSKSVRT